MLNNEAVNLSMDTWYANELETFSDIICSRHSQFVCVPNINLTETQPTTQPDINWSISDKTQRRGQQNLKMRQGR